MSESTTEVSGGGAISDGPLEGAVEVDWDRPLDEWETAFKDELFYWGPFFRGLGHGHMYLDANAKYALARIAGILHRQAFDASEARAEAAEAERDLWRAEWEQITETARVLQSKNEGLKAQAVVDEARFVKWMDRSKAAKSRLAAADALIASIERFGTYLDPRHYGDKYDHHTFTRIATEEGKWVAVYRLDDAALAAYEKSQPPGKMAE